MELLLQNLTKLTRLPESELVSLLPYFEPMTSRENTVLLSPGVVSSSVWFIGSGVLRAFHLVEQRKRSQDEDRLSREITNWIVPAGGFLTDVQSFLYQTPANYFVETLEACRLYRLSYHHYRVIQSSHPDIARAIFENTLIMADLRVQMCNLRAPESRLEMFEKMYPALKGRLSVNIQASYLNIDPTTLSRLRSARSKNKS
jgi:CRP-like cAMP-binding protein